MDTNSWSNNLESYYDKYGKDFLKYAKEDVNLMMCISDFFNENMDTLTILYDDISMIEKEILTHYMILCPKIEGVFLKDVVCSSVLKNKQFNQVQILYSILDKDINTLYELSFIEDKFDIKIDYNTLKIKCLIDNREPPYDKKGNLSIESRGKLKIFSVLEKNYAKSEK
jgi:hypothetical protein